MDDGSGPDSKYLFRPALITLDEDFRLARKLEADAFSNQPATSINTEKLRLGAVTGRLGFNEENRHDRYVIVLTEPAVLNETTTIVAHSPYPFTVRKFRHAPTGNIRIELTTTQDLFGEAKQRLTRKYESAVPGQRYEGFWFDVSPPSGGGYRFVDKSSTYYTLTHSNLNFVSDDNRRKSYFGNAFVQSYHLDSVKMLATPRAYAEYKNLDAIETLALAVESAQEEHKRSLHDARWQSAPLSLGGRNAAGSNRCLYVLRVWPSGEYRHG